MYYYLPSVNLRFRLVNCFEESSFLMSFEVSIQLQPDPGPSMTLSHRNIYRNILRLHRLLPAELRVVGDSYVKNEFNIHKKISNPAQLETFRTEWTKYFENLSGQVIEDYLQSSSETSHSKPEKSEKNSDRIKPLGRKLEMVRLSEFNDDQLYTLMELRKFASGQTTEADTNTSSKPPTDSKS